MADSINGIPTIPDNFVYNDDSLVRTYLPNELSNMCSVLHGVLGARSAKRANLHILREPDTIAFTAGNVVVLHPLDGAERRYIFGHGASIGCIAVNPDGNKIAVGECGHQPMIIIYSWPTISILRVLRNGSERIYSDLAWDPDGSKLASVGGDPDFLLILWNWSEERIVLRNKAFSQEVFRVHFSRFFPGRLITSGTGHIRFWNMARTFTGMKLQGNIGKFGNVELTDVAAIGQLPDGKIVSGTETGDLLLWEDNLIQFIIVKPDNEPCHKGTIEYINIDANTNMMMTAGRDGVINQWDISGLAYPDVHDSDQYFRLAPVRSWELGSVSIISLGSHPDGQWIVQDGHGAIRICSLSDEGGPVTSKAIVEYHAGAINAVAISPTGYIMVSAGQDGTIRSWDILTSQIRFTRRFDNAGRV